MNTILLTIPKDRIPYNECDCDVLVFYENYTRHDGKEFNYWIKYVKGGDIARFETVGELCAWLSKYVLQINNPTVE